MYGCYVIWSDCGKRFYIGVSEDVEARVAVHNEGRSKWTSRFAGTWRLVWQRRFETLGEARRFENELKRQKNGNGFYELTGLSQTAYSTRD